VTPPAMPPSTAVADVLVLHGLRGWLSPPLRSFHPARTAVLGTALTVQLEPADGSAPPFDQLYDLLGTGLSGRVIVIAGGDSSQGAVWGQILSRAAHGSGAAGALVAGAVRDVSSLADECLPVWGLAEATVGPAGTLRIASVDTTVEIGGVTVPPGCPVLHDSAGVVVLPPVESQAQRVLDDALAYATAEEQVLAELSAGAQLSSAYRHKRAVQERIRADVVGAGAPSRTGDGHVRHKH